MYGIPDITIPRLRFYEFGFGFGQKCSLNSSKMKHNALLK